LVAGFVEKIAKFGFTVVAVGTTDDKRGWAYTIGLVDNFDHPELVVAGVLRRNAGRLVAELGERVVSGLRLDPSTSPMLLHEAEVGIRPVHERHLHGDLVSAWHWYHEEVGRWEVEPRAIQLVVPDGGHCYRHQTTQPRLDRPHHVSYDGLTPSGRRPGDRRGGRVTPAGSRPQPSLRSRRRRR
jgi:hypothetical protein